MNMCTAKTMGSGAIFLGALAVFISCLFFSFMVVPFYEIKLKTISCYLCQNNIYAYNIMSL